MIKQTRLRVSLYLHLYILCKGNVLQHIVKILRSASTERSIPCV